MFRSFMVSALTALTLTTVVYAVPTYQSDAELKAAMKSVLDMRGSGGMRAFAAAAESAQVEGVEEGGIFSRSGDHLVYLRKGVIFAVDSKSSAELEQTDSIWGAHPSLDKNVWVDEMLVDGPTIITVSHRYAQFYFGVVFLEGQALPASAKPEDIERRSFTEINTFEISDSGKLSHKDHLLVEAFDYFSSDNYASRFVDGKFISVSPLSFEYEDKKEKTGVRIPKTYQVVNGKLEIQSSLLSAKDVFQPVERLSAESNLVGFHFCTVAPKLDCGVKAIFINDYRGEHYVTRENVYYWTNGSVFRLGIDSKELAHHPVLGSVLNQFSMSEIDGDLHVLAQHQDYTQEQSNSENFLYTVRKQDFKADIELSQSREALRTVELTTRLQSLGLDISKIYEVLYGEREISEQERERLNKQLEPLEEERNKLTTEMNELKIVESRNRSKSVLRDAWKADSVAVNRFVGSSVIYANYAGEDKQMVVRKLDVTKLKRSEHDFGKLREGQSWNVLQIVPLSTTHAAIVHQVSEWKENKQEQALSAAMFSAQGNLRMITEHQFNDSSSSESRSQAYGIRYDAKRRQGILTVPVKPAWVKQDWNGATHDIAFYRFDLNNRSFKNVYTYTPVEEDTKPTVGSLVDWYGSARVGFFTDSKDESRIIGVSGYAMAEIVEDTDGSLYTGQDLMIEIPEWQKKKLSEEKTESVIPFP